MKPIPGLQEEPELLDLLAQLLLRLSYGEMMCFAADLHSDIDELRPTPVDVAALLYRWAHRTSCDGVDRTWWRRAITEDQPPIGKDGTP